MDTVACAWLEFAKDKTRAVDDSERFAAFHASEDVEVDMLVRVDPNEENDGLIRPVTEDTFREPWIGQVVFVYEGVAIVKIKGMLLRGVKFP